MNEELIKNGEAQFAAIKLAALKVAEECDAITITDPITLSIQQQQLSLVKEKWNAVEAIRKKLKQPSLDEGKAVDELARPLLDILAQALMNGKNKILTWDRLLNQQLSVAPKGMREVMKFEVVDIEKVPMMWLQVNEAAVNEFKDQYKENIKDGDIITGIRFYLHKSVTVR